MDSKNEKKCLDQAGLFSVDFVPKCLSPDTWFKWPQFETFSTLFVPANAYLSDNPGLSVTSCETIHLLVEKDHVKEPNKSDYTQHGETLSPFVKGLRLWLQPRRDGSLIPQQLSYMTFLPKLDGRETGAETLISLKMQINEWLKENPIPGKIITFESLQLQGTDGEVDVDMTSWKPKASHSNFLPSFLSMFRIFYICGEPCFDEIGFADFFPDMLTVWDVPAKPQFPAIMENINKWINELPSNVRFLNLQTLLCRCENINEGPSKNAYKTLYWGSFFHVHYFRFLRVAFVTAKCQPVDPPSYFSVQLTTKLFTPALLSDPTWVQEAKFEPESATKDRMDNWVQQTQARVLAVETVTFKANSGAEKKEGFYAMRTWNEVTEKYEDPVNEQYVRCYRLSMEGASEDPEGFEWPRTMDDYRNENTSQYGCTIL